MYLAHWGMRVRPFENHHQPHFFVPYESAMLGLTKLRYATTSHLGVTCVLGAPGVGKTQLVRMLCMELDSAGWQAVYVPNPNGPVEEVMRMIASLLGAEKPAGSSARECLHLQLAALAEAGRSVCLVVDDLHTAGDMALLEGLRMLLNVEVGGRSAADVILAGQMGLEARLQGASGFASHLGMKISLAPMDAEETKKYILLRLKASGCNRGIFTRKAADTIYELSDGIPRNVNRICELSLATAYGLNVTKVGPDVIDMAASDLGIVRDILSGLPAGVESGQDDILAGMPGA